LCDDFGGDAFLAAYVAIASDAKKEPYGERERLSRNIDGGVGG